MSYAYSCRQYHHSQLLLPGPVLGLDLLESGLGPDVLEEVAGNGRHQPHCFAWNRSSSHSLFWRSLRSFGCRCCSESFVAARISASIIGELFVFGCGCFGRHYWTREPLRWRVLSVLSKQPVAAVTDHTYWQETCSSRSLRLLTLPDLLDVIPEELPCSVWLRVHRRVLPLRTSCCLFCRTCWITFSRCFWSLVRLPTPAACCSSSWQCWRGCCLPRN